VTRSGGVIPKILETLVEPTEDAMKLQREILKTCPVCGSATKLEEPEIYCANPDCDGVKLAKIIFFLPPLALRTWGRNYLKNFTKQVLRQSNKFSISPLWIW
jgi:NAD-dependent DNA ligase